MYNEEEKTWKFINPAQEWEDGEVPQKTLILPVSCCVQQNCGLLQMAFPLITSQKKCLEKLILCLGSGLQVTSPVELELLSSMKELSDAIKKKVSVFGLQ